jgi:succinyl-CoA synthetase alpha subunit
MAIFTEETGRVVIQGLTGGAGRNFAQNMALSGTNLVAGVRPGRGGQVVFGVPVFDTVAEATRATGATASVIAVPPAAVPSAVREAIDGGLRLAVVYAEGLPVHQALRLHAWASGSGCRVIGPNSAGVLSPGIANLSDLRTVPMAKGPVGLISKSGTLTYEVVGDLVARGTGVSTVVCLGGDPVLCTTAEDLLPLFAADPETKAIVLIGEPGGNAEVLAAERWCELGQPLPIVALIVGQTVPAGRRLGHAGAVASSHGESALEKMGTLKKLGARVADSLSEVSRAVREELSA